MNKVSLYEQTQVYTNARDIIEIGVNVSTKVLDYNLRSLIVRLMILLIMYRMKTMYRKINCKEHFCVVQEL